MGTQLRTFPTSIRNHGPNVYHRRSPIRLPRGSYSQFPPPGKPQPDGQPASKKNWNWRLTTIEHSSQWSLSVRSLEEPLCQWEDRPQRRPKDHRSMLRVLTRRASSSTSPKLPEANWYTTRSNLIIGTS